MKALVRQGHGTGGEERLSNRSVIIIFRSKIKGGREVRQAEVKSKKQDDAKLMVWGVVIKVRLEYPLPPSLSRSLSQV